MTTIIITTTVTTTVKSITTVKNDKSMRFYIDTSDVITYNNEYNYDM